MSAPTPNRLAGEKSPYLLQHAHNPVDWYPWGEEAFARARAEDKPVFLSIGYSTCHWCHVMERESFEDEAVAALLNQHFVPVKVDREERPDVDRLYMTAMQAMGQGGGWPLNVFLTPALAPFWGGTYFPPSTRHGRPGMTELLPRLADAWREHRDKVAESGEQVLRAVASLATVDREAESVAELVRQCEEWLARAHDAVHGGFGSAPKFPSPGNLTFLFRRFARDPSRTEARDRALAQLDAMIAGGIHDQLAGGFHRYSTDREWMVPHFEKMLYDQALIADNLLDAIEIARRPRHADALRALLACVARDLTAPGGAFWSAEDADAEGHEGRFHVWTPEQLTAALGEDDARLVALRYGVTPQGNFEGGATVLHEARSLAQVAAATGLSEGALTARLAGAVERLLAARSRRVRPHLDDKVLTAWNALMVAAMARAGRVLAEPGWTGRAERAMDFLWNHLRDGGGGFHRRWREGEAAGAGQLDDHAYTAHALLELHATTFEPRWLERALQVTDVMLERFWDDADGACFENPAGDPTVLLRMKDGFDGAELAGNSLACDVLVRLAALTGRDDLHQHAQRTIAYFARRLAGSAWAMPRLLTAMQRAATAPRHVVIVGAREAPDTRALLDVHRGRFRPFEDVLLIDPDWRDALAKSAPFTRALVPASTAATAFVCVDRACRLPVTDPAAFAAQLET